MPRNKHAEFIAKLRKARKLIVRGWTKHDYARDKAGFSVNPDSPKAAAWCLAGALCAAGLPKIERTFREGEKFVPLAYWNDAPGRTKDEVLACIDNSIAALLEG